MDGTQGGSITSVQNPALPAFRLGRTEVWSRLVLAPMSGYNDQPYRRLCRRFGAALVYTGLISSNAIVYGPGTLGNPRTEEMLQFHPSEQPVVCQLFGSDDGLIIEAARKVESLGAAAIDINLGCATPKVAG
ncbi:MAG: tRNA-dihydrouridine synthase family protein, partial [Anaerolineae bacterium]|nr:tRNA-dihydrouridine synthase family protein [Anaerolineae bacterium]